jgi:Helix-turn-helix family
MVPRVTPESAAARRLGSVLEPVTGQVYFSPECHKSYEALGFGPSAGEFNGVPAPDGPAYFTSRGSVLGQVPGTVVAATFGVFNPEAVVPAVTFGWTKTDAATICQARTDGAVAQLERILGSEPEGVERANELLARAVAPLRPEGRSLFAGQSSLPLPETTLGQVWRRGDMLREYRGDSHIAAWIGAGLDATEIGLLTELYWGLPMRTYSRTRAWTDAQFDAATERLEGRGLIADGAMTPAGQEHREAIEVETDRQMAPVLRALGDDIEELFEILAPWGVAIREAKGYPAAGPHDLANASG